MTTSLPASTTRRSPGRPRSAAAHQAILDATVQLLSEVGFAATTVEAVAARAGVGKATVYRRWPSKVPLVIDALDARAIEQVPIPRTGSVRGDLIEFLAEHRIGTQPGLLEAPVGGVHFCLGGL